MTECPSLETFESLFLFGNDFPHKSLNATCSVHNNHVKIIKYL